jgi:hypothetical protein
VRGGRRLVRRVLHGIPMGPVRPVGVREGLGGGTSVVAADRRWINGTRRERRGRRPVRRCPLRGRRLAHRHRVPAGGRRTGAGRVRPGLRGRDVGHRRARRAHHGSGGRQAGQGPGQPHGDRPVADTRRRVRDGRLRDGPGPGPRLDAVPRRLRGLRDPPRRHHLADQRLRRVHRHGLTRPRRRSLGTTGGRGAGP